MNEAEQATAAPSIAPSIITRRLAAIAFADVAALSLLLGHRDVDTVRRWYASRRWFLVPPWARPGGRRWADS